MNHVWRLFEQYGYDDYGVPKFEHIGLFWTLPSARHWCWQKLSGLSDPEAIKYIQIRDVTPFESEFAHKKIVWVDDDDGHETVYETWYLRHEQIHGKGEG